LIEARKRTGLTQAEIADKLEKPQSFVSKYERGKRRLDIVEFLRIADALGVDPHYIITRVASFQQ
jgi:transcriptional regulator with XRE-family HTH domain